MKWFEIKAAAIAANQRPEIYIYDDIGMGGIYADEFIRDLNALGSVDAIDVRINSRGGSVIEGVAIFLALSRHPATIHVHIDGMAASIASLIMLAGNHIDMSEVSQIMVHQASTIAMGNADEMEAVVEQLRQVDAILVSQYMRKTGLSEAAVVGLLQAETFMNAEQAHAQGFVDTIVSPSGEPQAKTSHDDVMAYLASLSTAGKPAQISPSAASALAHMTATLSDGSDHRDQGKGDVMNKSELIAKLKEVGVDVPALETQASQASDLQDKLAAAQGEVTAMHQIMGEHSHDDVAAALTLLDETRATLVDDIVAHQRVLGLVQADNQEAEAQAKAALDGMSISMLKGMEAPLKTAATAKQDFEVSPTAKQDQNKRRTARKTTQE